METLTADPAPPAEPEAPQEPAGTAPQPAPQAPAPACGRCGAPLAPGQDWCLECGTGAPGSTGSSGWRPAAAVAAGAAVLALGAAAAGYAALSKSPPHAHVLTTTVASATPPAATPTPTPAVPPASTLPPVSSKVPKIPLQTPTPKAAPTIATPPAAPSTTTPAKGTPSGGSEPAAEEPSSNAIVLDTNAASTYNPYAYPATSFGDPSLAIDGDTTTGWTAQATPPTAPKMAVGLMIDLKSAQRVSSLQLVSATPGFLAQVYGTNASTPPASITDPAWKRLTKAMVLHKRHEHLALKESAHSFRYVVLWVSRAASTSTAGSRVSVNELELFPAG